MIRVSVAINGRPDRSTESLEGYLLRIADINVFGGIPRLLRLAESKLRDAKEQERAAELNRMAGFLRVSCSDLDEIMCKILPGNRLRFNSAAEIYADDRCVGSARVCGACLKERPVLKRVWELRPYVACPVHRSPLVGRCRCCGTVVTWRRSSLARCDCRTPLVADDGAVVSDALLAVAGLLDALHEGGSSSSGLDLATTLRLVWYCGARAAIWGTGARSRFMARPEPERAAAIVEVGAPSVLNWPHGFHAWLSSVCGDSSQGVRKAFGHVDHSIRSAFPHADSALVAEEAAAWFASTWRGRPPRRNSTLHRPSIVQSDLPLSAAARACSMSPAMARRLLREGNVTARVLPAGTRTLAMVDVAGLGEAGAARRAEPARPHAAQALSAALGCSPAQAKRIARLCEIAVSPSGAESLESRLEQMAHRSPAPADALNVAVLSRRRQASIPRLLASLLDGAVDFWLGEDGAALLERLSFRQGSLISPTGGALGSISVREAAARLGVKPAMIPILVAAGCLGARPTGHDNDVGSRPRGKRALQEHDIVSFGDQFVMTRQVASQTGTSTRRAVAQLLAAGCVPVVASDSVRGISAVWRAADVDRSAVGKESGSNGAKSRVSRCGELRSRRSRRMNR